MKYLGKIKKLLKLQQLSIILQQIIRLVNN